MELITCCLVLSVIYNLITEITIYSLNREYKSLKQNNEELLKEITRLKEGNFTEEEFQNLCHNFSADDKCRFKQGCVDYQRKLFGE